MAKFDPNRHRVVAVPYQDNDPERGQHFHVDLDELVTASFDVAPTEGGELTVNPFLVKRLEAAEARVTELAHRVDELEARPYVSEDVLKQLDDGLNAKISHMIEKHANRALGDIRSRLVTIERNTTTTVAGSDPDSAKLAKLAEIVSSLGSYVSEIESTVEQRHGALEQQYAELAEHITDTNLKTMKLSTRLYRALQALEHDADAA